MTHELVQLSSGELRRLQGALQSGMLSLAHADAGLLHANIAGSNNQLRSAISQCLQRWDACGGSSSALAEAIAGLMRQRESGQNSSSELVWSGPEMGNGDTTRDQAIVIREMVEQVQHRLLLTTYNIAPYGFIKELLALIQLRMQAAPSLEARVVLNIARAKEHDRTQPHCLVAKFHATNGRGFGIELIAPAAGLLRPSLPRAQAGACRPCSTSKQWLPISAYW